MSASEVITLFDGSNITSAQCRGSDYLGHKYKLIGAGCSNQKQLTQGHSHLHDFANVQADYGTLLHPTPTVSKMVSTLCNLHSIAYSLYIQGKLLASGYCTRDPGVSLLIFFPSTSIMNGYFLEHSRSKDRFQ